MKLHNALFFTSCIADTSFGVAKYMAMMTKTGFSETLPEGQVPTRPGTPCLPHCGQNPAAAECQECCATVIHEQPWHCGEDSAAQCCKNWEPACWNTPSENNNQHSCNMCTPVTTTTTTPDTRVFDPLRFFLLNNYGNQQVRRRRCHRNPWGERRCSRNDDSDYDLLEWLLSFKVIPGVTTTTTTFVCFPGSAMFERQLSNGEYEQVRVTNLTVGDHVKCLKAPQGPLTTEPQVGSCRHVSVGHNEPDAALYEQIFYMDETGNKKVLALSNDHMLWSSADRSLPEGPVASVNISNAMFVPAGTIQPNDLIIVLDSNNQMHYRKVIAHQVRHMDGIHNPMLLDGGMPFVDGVLATTSAVATQGGHWVNYYKRIWRQDAKFVDPAAEVKAYMAHPWFQGEQTGKIRIDNECFLERIVSDLKQGVDVTDYTNYTVFGEVYIAPCVIPAVQNP